MTNNDENDAAWDVFMEALWRNKRIDLDQRWGSALDLLQNLNNPDGVLAMLAGGAAVPDWVRKEIDAWRAGKRPPLVNVSERDEKLLAAVHAYHHTPKVLGEKREQRIERIAAEYGVSKTSLENFLDCEGGTYRRLVRDQRRWEDSRKQQQQEWQQQAATTTTTRRRGSVKQ